MHNAAYCYNQYAYMLLFIYLINHLTHMSMNELGIGVIMIAGCSIGLSAMVIAVVSILHYRENKRSNSMMKEMDGMNSSRYTLNKQYTDKELGFERE